MRPHISTYRYLCPRGHRWNADGSRFSPSTRVCPSCGYSEDEGGGPIIDTHAAVEEVTG